MLAFCSLYICEQEVYAQNYSQQTPIPSTGVETVNDSIGMNLRLDEVTVLSFKQDKDFKNTPIAASNVSNTTIDNLNITNIKEIAGLVPNLFMPDYGSKLTSPVYIRGIGSKINSPSVGLYVDGVPYFEKSAFDFDFDQIDRIEVLRGPQGTLYGRNTMGGIINVYTKSPFRYQGTNIRLDAGSYGMVNASASTFGTLGSKTGYSLAGSYKHHNGYFTNSYLGKKADKLNSASARMRISNHLTDRLDMHLTASFEHMKQGGYPYAEFDTLTMKPGAVSYDEYSSYKRNMVNAGLTFDYKGNGFKLNAQTSFQHTNDDQNIDQDFSPAHLYFVNQSQRINTIAEEINIKSATSSHYQWLFGWFGFYQKSDNGVTMDYHKQNMRTHKTYDNPTIGTALYHQSSFNDFLIKNLSLVLGLRFDYEHASSDYIAMKYTQDKNQQTDAFDASLNFTQLLPKLALQYAITDQQNVYGSIAKGYKTGGFNTSFITDDEKTFKPEHSWNYEVGYKSDFFNNRLSMDFCLFYIDWRNQQIYQPLSTGKGQLLKNAGKSSSKGIELSMQVRPIRYWNINANYGYTHASFKKYQRNETTDYAGNKLPLVPSHTLSLSTDYSLIMDSHWCDRLVFSAQGNGVGKIYWNEDNKNYQPFYATLNAKIAYVKSFLTLELWAKNITNTHYTSYYFESQNKAFAQRGKPFTCGVNLVLNL